MCVFSKNSSHLYYLTDQGGEFAYLVKRDLTTEMTTPVEKADWDIMFASLSETGKYLVLGVNNDARTEIRVYETATHKPVTLPDMPDGDITGLGFSKSERLMLFYMNGDRSPNNLFVLDMERGMVRQLTNSMNPEINAEHLVDGSVIRFASYDGLEIPSLLELVAAGHPLAGYPGAHRWETALEGLSKTESDVLAEASNTNPREPEPALGRLSWLGQMQRRPEYESWLRHHAPPHHRSRRVPRIRGPARRLVPRNSRDPQPSM